MQLCVLNTNVPYCMCYASVQKHPWDIIPLSNICTDTYIGIGSIQTSHYYSMSWRRAQYRTWRIWKDYDDRTMQSWHSHQCHKAEYTRQSASPCCQSQAQGRWGGRGALARHARSRTLGARLWGPREEDGRVPFTIIGPSLRIYKLYESHSWTLIWLYSNYVWGVIMNVVRNCWHIVGTIQMHSN